MLTVRIQEKNHSESIMVLKLKDGWCCSRLCGPLPKQRDTSRNSGKPNCYGESR